MTKKPYKVVTKKQQPVLPADLRSLPGSIVTNEIGDDSKIHKNDPKHIRKAIVKAAAKKEKAVLGAAIVAHAYMTAWLKGIAKGDRQRKVTQETVDILKGWHLARMASHGTLDFSPQYLWLPAATGWMVELRKGHPPASGERPKHLRGLDLRVNLLHWPQRVLDSLKEGGVNIKRLMEDIHASKKNQEFWESVEAARGGLGSPAGEVRQGRILGPSGRPYVN